MYVRMQYDAVDDVYEAAIEATATDDQSSLKNMTRCLFVATRTLAARRTSAISRQRGSYSDRYNWSYPTGQSLPRGRSDKNTTAMGACFSTSTGSRAPTNPRTDVVLAYWLGDPVRYRALWDPCATPENQTKWFMKSDEVDQEIKRRFGEDVAGLPEMITAATASGTTEDKVAAIILGDQMTRNIYRGTSEMYQWDPIVLPLAKRVVARDDFMSLPLTFKIFSLLPLMHSEELADQRACVDWVQRIREAAPEEEEEARAFLENMHGYAKKHYDVVEAWSRFPHRNMLLGRASTPEEQLGLADGTIASF